MAKGNKRFGKKLEKAAENGATQAVLTIVGTVAFGAVIWLWNSLRNG